MTIKTWKERCEEHPDHSGIVTSGMIRERMMEEIEELRAALAAEKEKDYVVLFTLQDAIKRLNWVEEQLCEPDKEEDDDSPTG